MHNSKFDEIDTAILEKLQKNGRITNAQLANEVGISPSAMLERVKRLERTGVIRKYVAIVDPEKIGRNMFGLVSVSLAAHQYSSINRFESEISKLSEVLECYNIAGEYDFLIKIICSSMKEYQEFLIKKLTKIEGIDKVHTNFILSTVKHSTVIPLKQET